MVLKRNNTKMERLEHSGGEPLIQEELLITGIKKGLLNWYDFKPSSAVLFIGEEQDIYSDICREKGMDVTIASPELALASQWIQEHTNRFEYIISIQELERLENPEEILKIWKSLLKPDGTLLLGMNNRYGLKYFCGDRDPYTERNFDGIEGYRRAYAKKEDKFTGRCYSREEMREMLLKAGWKSMQFFSVLSDLDNPRLIYGEDDFI